MDLNKYTTLQLRKCLQQLNLSTSGTKSAQILRLGEVPIEERGVCPADSDNVVANESVTIEDYTIDEIRQTNMCEREYELVRRELELVKKENGLLAKENKFHKEKEEWEKKKSACVVTK